MLTLKVIYSRIFRLDSTDGQSKIHVVSTFIESRRNTRSSVWCVVDQEFSELLRESDGTRLCISERYLLYSNNLLLVCVYSEL